MSRLFVVIASLFLVGCATPSFLQGWGSGGDEPKLLDVSYKAGDHLHGQLDGSGVARYPMLAASFVDSANMNDSTDLGRLLSEQVASRLSQLGYSVTEVQLRSDQLRVDPGVGVLALSRDLAEINADAQAYSVLVGTYTVIGRQIYVNARVLRASDGVALASSDFSLPYVSQQKADKTASGGGGVQPSVKTLLN
jgi:TolB-like protein